MLMTFRRQSLLSKTLRSLNNLPFRNKLTYVSGQHTRSGRRGPDGPLLGHIHGVGYALGTAEEIGRASPASSGG